jgi:antitoxin (DNA-binding transcriptional repressor) of toxin-antitoxin stability system
VAGSLAIEDIYDDPHKLDPFLGTGEPVVVLKDGREVAWLMPIHPSGRIGTHGTAGSGKPDFRARFLKMWGADAFQSGISVSEDLEQLRSCRVL